MFSPDVLHNQIVKTTLRNLANVGGGDADMADGLRDLDRRMPGVSEIGITDQTVRRVMLGRSNSYYRFLLDVCEIVYRNLLVSEDTGQTEFRDFTRDDTQMARPFEKFLFNFFKKEQGAFAVTAPRFAWEAIGDVEQLSYLPQMRTDIVLENGRQSLVIDAKYYAETLSEHLTKASIRSGHLYQIFSYMSHLVLRSDRRRVRGLLIYPKTIATVRVRVMLFGHPFVAATVNLTQRWPDIRTDLLTLIADIGNESAGS